MTQLKTKTVTFAFNPLRLQRGVELCGEQR